LRSAAAAGAVEAFDRVVVDACDEVDDAGLVDAAAPGAAAIVAAAEEEPVEAGIAERAVVPDCDRLRSTALTCSAERSVVVGAVACATAGDVSAPATWSADLAERRRCTGLAMGNPHRSLK
jgi:hypothetical protein